MPTATMNQTEETYSGDSYWYHEDILNVTVSNSTSVFQSPLSPLVDKAISCITIIILFITMVSLGCTMEISKIKAHILKPKGVAIAVVAQYGIMPLTAFTLAKVFQLGSIESVTVLICGCCPGGNLSNIFALALKGDMNLRKHGLKWGPSFMWILNSTRTACTAGTLLSHTVRLAADLLQRIAQSTRSK
ncbi:UNVERIFIED_CONTAM: hypothetical protein FKN15_061568 [Acipenser sinensis]